MNKKLINQIDALLPQTQCGLCKYDACRPYAEAIAKNEAPINRCLPGGVEKLVAIAECLNLDPASYIPEMERKAKLPAIAVIRENECIGCTKCIQACPTDAIIGAAKQMHTIISDACTGCELCLPVCPIDCIDIQPTILKKNHSAQQWRLRYENRQKRLNRDKTEQRSNKISNLTVETRKAAIHAAVLRVKKKESAMHQSRLEEIFRRFKAHNSEPVLELIYRSKFELLISVMLSAQATDISVNKYTKELYKVANTPRKILELGEEGLKQYIKSIGLFNSKAKNIIKTCKILVENHGSKIPNTREDLEALPGIGRKTANVILNTAFGQKTIAVDTHVFRVSKRIGLAYGKTPLEIEKKLMGAIPQKYLVDAHHWLVIHGRYICMARRPKCSDCLINDLCEYPDKTG